MFFGFLFEDYIAMSRAYLKMNNIDLKEKYENETKDVEEASEVEVGEEQV